MYCECLSTGAVNLFFSILKDGDMKRLNFFYKVFKLRIGGVQVHQAVGLTQKETVSGLQSRTDPAVDQRGTRPPSNRKGGRVGQG